MIQLFAVKECLELGEPPAQSSAALAIGIIRDMLDRRHEEAPESERMQIRFQKATKDAYKRRRPKRARFRPNYKDKPKAGHPNVINAGRIRQAQYQKHLAWVSQNT